MNLEMSAEIDLAMHPGLGHYHEKYSFKVLTNIPFKQIHQGRLKPF